MRNHRKNEAVVLVTLVAIVYLGIWLWCKLTGQRAEFES